MTPDELRQLALASVTYRAGERASRHGDPLIQAFPGDGTEQASTELIDLFDEAISDYGLRRSCNSQGHLIAVNIANLRAQIMRWANREHLRRTRP